MNPTGIKLCHISNKINNNNVVNDKTYLMDVSALKKSSVLLKKYDSATSNTIYINKGDDDALIFIIKYLHTYKEIGEIAPLEHPLTEESSLTELFEFEEHIFGDLLSEIEGDEKHIRNDQIVEKGIRIKNIIEIAEELDIDTLLKKMYPIMCYHLQKLE